MLIKGIISFPTLFTPKIPKGANEAKFSCAVLIPANDPQVAQINAAIEAAKVETFPGGYTGTDECFSLYDAKYQGKDYYDPRFAGWYVITCTAKADDRPAVVNTNYEKVVDPGSVFSGMVAHVNIGISGYVKGTGGIGGWLNGVMITEEEPPMGRLDNKPTVEQMFAGVGGVAPAPVTAAPVAAAPVAAPAPAPAAPAPAPSAPAPQYLMTDKAQGFTREQYLAQNWTDEALIAQGMMIAPSFA